jgi:hypothetical protein
VRLGPDNARLQTKETRAKVTSRPAFDRFRRDVVRVDPQVV